MLVFRGGRTQVLLMSASCGTKRLSSHCDTIESRLGPLWVVIVVCGLPRDLGGGSVAKLPEMPHS